MNKKLLLCIITYQATLFLPTYSMQTPDRFERAAKRAEQKYQQSSSEEANVELKNQESTDASPANNGKNNKPNAADLSSSSKPILSQHEQFSDEWWSALFDKCDCPCSQDEPLDCEKLLKRNPQWQEVKSMNQKTKDLTIKKAGDRLEQNSNGTGRCNMACAACAGADPNTRNNNFHLPLHVANFFFDGSNDLFLTELLVKKGANINEKCQPVHPAKYLNPETLTMVVKTVSVRKLNEPDNYGDTFVHNLSKKCKKFNSDQAEKIGKALLEKGYKDHKNLSGKTAAEIAAKKSTKCKALEAMLKQTKKIGINQNK